MVLSFLMERKHIDSTSGYRHPIRCELYSHPWDATWDSSCRRLKYSSAVGVNQGVSIHRTYPCSVTYLQYNSPHIPCQGIIFTFLSPFLRAFIFFQPISKKRLTEQAFGAIITAHKEQAFGTNTEQRKRRCDNAATLQGKGGGGDL